MLTRFLQIGARLAGRALGEARPAVLEAGSGEGGGRLGRRRAVWRGVKRNEDKGRRRA